MEKKEENLYIEAAYADEDYIYASSDSHNAFYQISRRNFEVKYLGSFTGFQHDLAWKIKAVYRKEDLLYWFSDKSYEVAAYDLKKREMVDYFHPDIYDISFPDIHTTCRVGDEIWIFRDSLHPLVCVFSLANRGYTFKFLPLETQLQKPRGSGSLEQKVKFENSYFLDGKIWKCVPGTNIIYSLDVADLDIEVYQVPGNIRIMAINIADDKCYITTIDGRKLVCWQNGKESVIDMPQKYIGQERAFRDIIALKDGFLVVPNQSEFLLYFKEGRHSFELLHTYEKTRIWGEFSTFLEDDKVIFLLPYGTDDLVEINKENLELFSHRLVVPDSDSMKRKIQLKEIILEDKRALLRQFLDHTLRSL